MPSYLSPLPHCRRLLPPLPFALPCQRSAAGSVGRWCSAMATPWRAWPCPATYWSHLFNLSSGCWNPSDLASLTPTWPSSLALTLMPHRHLKPTAAPSVVGQPRVEMAMGTRNPINFYSIRVRVWVNFFTHRFVNRQNARPAGLWAWIWEYSTQTRESMGFSNP